ncbi:hypothetical protein BCR36DRAFT_3981 [Piromyces finnis]|uniref:Uncharacterized protein n=1 Tax=Piromyces finnis TaxID=1754191 RepID=A0A1Y1VNU1_9FUNG|nr:hypothetical protein BCR36DRAFT_3981 [Piromyces finnis]|eukprot:ORX60940.1 hypothetical protein BCR36DRAFT_3981 [Piromyces finnis]
MYKLNPYFCNNTYKILFHFINLFKCYIYLCLPLNNSIFEVHLQFQFQKLFNGVNRSKIDIDKLRNN